MSNKEINFQEVLGTSADEAASDQGGLEQFVEAVNQIAEQADARLTEIEAVTSALDGRMQMIEKYVAFLLTKNPDFKDWLKTQIDESKVAEDVGQITDKQAT